ncbi:hypothetical protein FGO68_gene13452 [Halteria grandinella]|uniref:Uncharacterized protein n=1 Tax=Halteria grandinella TaxID=5974 RepID=A0A8J8NLL5_HALGN|nr:hypothetical protein FGO68_gene13452 [Halteria grandinella]
MSQVEAALSSFSLDQLLFGTQESIPLHLEASTAGVDKIDNWWKGVRQEFKVLKPYTESLFISAFFVKQMFFVYSLGSLALWYPSQSLSIYLQGLLASILPVPFVDVIFHTFGMLNMVALMYGLRSSLSLFQDVPRYQDAIELEKCSKNGVQSGHCTSIKYEILGTTLITMFYNGVLFGLMEAAKPANSIFMMYLPMVLQGWFGLGDHEMFPVQIAYFGLELLLTGVPQVPVVTPTYVLYY